MPSALLIVFALASLCWAGVETVTWSHMVFHTSMLRAKEQALAARLRELGRGVPREQMASQVVVFTPSLFGDAGVLSDSLPTDVPQPVLWAEHMIVFGGDWREYKERLYQNLYYAGVDRNEMETLARAEPGHLRFVFFAYNLSPQPVDAFPKWVVADYLAYVSSFDRERAARSQLTYLVVPNSSNTNLANLDRWYERDPGEKLGELVLYRLKLR